MSSIIYEFERPIAELEEKIEHLEEKAEKKPDPEIDQEIENLKAELEDTRKEIYSNMTPWQRVQIARHIDRPHSLDYIESYFEDWTEVHGDRGYADDPAVVCGFGTFDDHPVTIIAQQKGKDTRENLRRNFGMMHPEGYRKALRVMKLAHRYTLPIIIFIDTPGAYPGIGAEERGQAEAIANNIKEMFNLKVPILIIVIGEGASGGALGIGLGDTVLMLENSWYCVISPEGCASILWRDRAMAPQSAEALKLTAPDLLELNVIDEIVPEPLGGAHRDHYTTFKNVRAAIKKHLEILMAKSVEDLVQQRFDKYRRMGVFLSKDATSNDSAEQSHISLTTNDND